MAGAAFVGLRAGAWSRTSDNADSPWYDNSTISALASTPYAHDVADTFNTGAFAISAPTGTVSGTGAGTIAAGGSLTLGAYAFSMGLLTGTTTGALTTGAGLLTVPNFTIGAGGVFHIGSGGIAGLTTSWTNNGTLQVDPGATISVTPTTYNVAFGGVLNWVGTNVNPIIFANLNNNNANTMVVSPSSGSILVFVQANAGLNSASTTSFSVPALIKDCIFDTTNNYGNSFSVQHSLQIVPNRVRYATFNSAGGNSGVVCPPISQDFAWSNFAIGYSLNGSSKPVATGISQSEIWDIQAISYFRNVIINATTPVFVTCPGAEIVVDNLGHVDPTMLPGTGSALDSAQVSPGISKVWTYYGTAERSTTSPYSGESYLMLHAPSSAVTSSLRIGRSIFVPVVSGDTGIVISGHVARNASMTNTTPCIMTADPEQAWGTSVSHQPTLTNSGTLASNPYAITVSYGAVGGTAAKGKLRVALETAAYVAGGTTMWGRVTAVVTHADATTTTYYFSMQNWENGQPESDAPTQIALNKIYGGTANDFGTATLRGSTIHLAAGFGDALTTTILASGKTVDDVGPGTLTAGGGGPVIGSRVIQSMKGS